MSTFPLASLLPVENKSQHMLLGSVLKHGSWFLHGKNSCFKNILYSNPLADHCTCFKLNARNFVIIFPLESRLNILCNFAYLVKIEDVTRNKKNILSKRSHLLQCSLPCAGLEQELDALDR